MQLLAIRTAGLLPLVFLAARVTAAEPARLRATILDAATGQPTACSVTLVDAAGRVVVERESFRAGFRCAGQFEQQLPPGRTRLRVTRGLETRAVEQEVELVSGQATAVTLRLERRVNLRQRGWYAGDSHAHMIHGERTIPVDFDFVALTAQAEDLHHLSLSHAWQMEAPTPEKLAAELSRRSTPDCVLTWNLEAPKNYYLGDAGRCLGHCWSVATEGRTPDGEDVIGLLLAASAGDYESAKPSYANFESHALIHAQGGAVFYTHPLRWWTGAWGGQGGYPRVEKMRVSNMAVELPLDVLIGPTFDGLDVITGAGEFYADQKSFRLWALLLNHGYRLAATASSDACFDRPGGAVPGAARTYTYLPAGFSLPAVARATAAGRTFVTTGPLLLATVDGQPPGSAFVADGHPHELQLEAWPAGSDAVGLRRLEVWRNGQPVQTTEFNPPRAAWQTNLVLTERASCWYTVRLFGGDLQRQRAISGAFYFDKTPHQPPPPVPARIQVRVTDAATGRSLASTVTELTFLGPRPREGRRHPVPEGEASLTVPGTVRLRAEAAGYAPVTLSPFLDHPALVELVTQLEDKDLLEWQTYERIRALLAEVKLDFALRRAAR